MHGSMASSHSIQSIGSTVDVYWGVTGPSLMPSFKKEMRCLSTFTRVMHIEALFYCRGILIGTLKTLFLDWAYHLSMYISETGIKLWEGNVFVVACFLQGKENVFVTCTFLFSILWSPPYSCMNNSFCPRTSTTLPMYWTCYKIQKMKWSGLYNH